MLKSSIFKLKLSLMKYFHDPLWLRIADYNFNDPNAALPFSQKLAIEQNWSSFFTQKAIAEYRRFIYLCCISPDGVTPSAIIDEVGLLHLTYSVDNWELFCRHVLQKDIQHHLAACANEVYEDYIKCYERTLQLYKTTFNDTPQIDIWRPLKPSSSPSQLSNNPDHFSFFEAGSYLRFLILLLPFIFIAVFYGKINPFALAGEQFLTFYSVLVLSSLAIMWLCYMAQEALLFHRLSTHLSVSPSPTELAFLAGGERRVALLIISELINEKHIIQVNKTHFKIIKERFDTYNGPVKVELIQFLNEDIHFNDLIKISAKEASPYYDKYRYLKSSFNNPTKNIITPLLVVVIGIAGTMHGLANNGNVGYLIFLMITYGWLILTLIELNNFYSVSRKILNYENPSLVLHISDFSTEVILNGLESLFGIELFYNFMWLFQDNAERLEGSRDHIKRSQNEKYQA